MRHLIYAGLLGVIGFGGVGFAAEASNQSAAALQLAEVEAFNRLEQGYEAQRSALQQGLGEGVFVASYKGVLHEGHIVTFSIWTDSVPTALPKTDFVWLQDPKLSHWYVVSLSELESKVPDLSKIDQLGPTRYLTPTKIPADFFAKLEKDFQPPKGFPERMASGRR